MAEGGFSANEDTSDFRWTKENVENIEEQKDEISSFQALFEVEGDKRFRVVNEGPTGIGDNQVFCLQFSVPVKSEYDHTKVDICIPEEEMEEMTENCHPKRVVIQRSQSRNIVMASFEVKYLTPLKLTVVLPPDYPSCSPPIFTLSSSWLSGDELTSLCSQLDKLWEELPSMPILSTWIDWLEHSTMSHLGLTDRVFIQQLGDLENIDDRAVFQFDNIDDMVNEMFRYNFEEETAEFQRHDQECEICFCEKSGYDFYRLLPCKHHFCKECLAEHCAVLVKEGTVQNLLCPGTNCKSEIFPEMLQDLLLPELYERWEKLILQYGLDMMGDILYCPRCQTVVVKNEDLGQCMSCMHAFCTKCMEKWHQGSDCFQDEEDDEKSLKTDKNGGNKKSTKSDGGEGGASEQEKEERLSKRRQLRESLNLIRSKTRQCKGCKANIEKNGGCNKVQCTRCNHAMCWACGKDITKESYEHFTSSPKCSQWDGGQNNFVGPLRRIIPQEIFEIDQAIRTGGDKAKNNIKACPRCHQRNLREKFNNHMKCWNCNSSFCFLCKQVIRPPYTKHFRETSCKQHTRDEDLM